MEEFGYIDRQNLRLVESKVGYIFRDKFYLETALTHSSFAKPNRLESNEVLEFLGDSVTDLIVGNLLIKQNPLAREGWLSQRRAELVNTTSMAKVAQKICLPEHIVFGPGSDYLRTQERICANAMEAVIGAAFQDGGLSAAERVIRKVKIV